ncbi:hypothetical protein MMC13_002065 [Lambiella insularis]|nr:hypothetical protein [Lambiella insularis]
MGYRSSLAWLVIAARSFELVCAQTSTKCNPLQGTCPADLALGKSERFDFTQGAPSGFSASGVPTYDSTNGASFTVAKSGDAPTLISNWFMMFGHVEVVLKAAPGVGIVSSMVLQSDDLDEIDYEWLGADNTQVQSNYFGKGQTTTYNRGAFHPDPSNQDGFHTYTVDWTADQIVWQIDGNTVRALTQASAEAGQYPQTPMQLKLGVWSGGDSSNAPGTIQWAGGATTYTGGPYTMQVKSVSATDYSTGTQYTYGDTSGSWQSIKSAGGTINSSGSSADASAAASAPAVTAVSNGAPLPFSGTHRDSTSTYTTPDVYPWVTSVSTVQSASTPVTTIPGLPSGWTINPSGKVVPPSAAPSTFLPTPSTSSAAVLPPGSYSGAAAGYDVITQYDQQGFLTVVTEPAWWSTASKSYDVQGYLITPAPAALTASPTSGIVVGQEAADTTPSSSSTALMTVATAAAHSNKQLHSLGAAACGILAGALIL